MIIETLREMYVRDVDGYAALVEVYRMEGHPTTDWCVSCSEEFGESGETDKGFNSECVSCGGGEYETIPDDEGHFEEWACARGIE